MWKFFVAVFVVFIVRENQFVQCNEITDSETSDAYAEWDGIPGEEHVHKLTDENMKSFLKSHESVLLFYYAPWCGHCEALIPEYARAAATLAGISRKSILATINCTEYPRVRGPNQIKSYPTIKYYRYGELYGKYTSGRQAKNIIEFMKEPPTEKEEL